MKISAEEFGELTGISLTLMDRRVLRSESKFKITPYPDFTEEELQSREETIRKLCEKADQAAAQAGLKDWVKNYYAIAGAWHISHVFEGRRSEQTRSLGKKIFGSGFDKYEDKVAQAKDAAIFPDSPYLGDKEFSWYCLGLENIEVCTVKKDVHTTHEVGHALFPIPLGETRDEKIGFLSESLADGFTVYMHLDLGDDPEVVQDFINARWLNAFLNYETKSHWTAAACEATLRKKPLPSLSEAVDPIRNLQIRAGINLQMKDKNLKGESNSWLKSLAHILINKKNFSPIEYDTGRKILMAYNSSCPEESEAFVRPLGNYTESPLPGLIG